MLASKASQIIKEQTNLDVSVGGVSFRPFAQLVLKDVFISDLNNDTLISAKSVNASIFGVNFSKGAIRLNKAYVQHAHVNLAVDSSGMLNIKALIDYAFHRDTTKKKDNSTTFSIRNVKVSNTVFHYHKANHKTTDYGVNYEDMLVQKINLDVRNLNIAGDTVSMSINSLNFTEQSGLCISDLRCNFSISSKLMRFDKLRIAYKDTELAMHRAQLAYNNYEELGHFVEKVNLYGDFANTAISTELLSYFVPALKGYSIPIAVNGIVRGKVCDLRGRNLEITHGKSTVISTNINLTGLPNIEETLFDIDCKELTSRNSDLRHFTRNNGKTLLINLPPLVDSLGKITYSGKFVGYITNFATYGTLNTDIGRVILDASFIPSRRKGYRYVGKINALDVDVGRLLGAKMLGKTSLSATIDGTMDSQKKLNAKTNVDIFSLVANGYNYSNIQIEGNLTNRTYIGSINLNDPNCKLNFLGKLDFSDSIPEYDFSAFVPKVDLVALNFNKVDSISQMAFLLTTKFSGSNLDNSRGEIKLVNSSYRNQRGEFKLSEIAILANNNKDSKVVTLKSEFAEGELRSKYNYSNIINYFVELVSKYIPAFSKNNEAQPIASTNVEHPEFNDYLIKLRVKKTSKITEVLIPDLKIAENSSIFGILNPDLQTLTFKLMVPEIIYKKYCVKNLGVDGQTRDTSLVAVINAPSILIGENNVRNFNITLEAMRNNVGFNLGWNNRNTPLNKGNIAANINFLGYGVNGHIANINFIPSILTLNDSTWNIVQSSVFIDSSTININQFRINSKTQNLAINGSISKSPADTLSLTLNNLNTAALNLYFRNMGYAIDGYITGVASVSNLYSKPNIDANLNINNTLLNREPVGNIHFASKWFDEQKRMAITLTNTIHDTLTFNAHGSIYTSNNDIDIDVKINRLKLTHLVALLKGSVSDIRGKVNGQVNIGGNFQKPLLNGTINVDEASLVVDFLKTKYTISSPIGISNSDFFFNNFRITDVNHNEAILNGSITSKYFKDIGFDLNLTTKNFQCMNTTEHDNASFYARAYGTGVAMVSGNTKKIDMNIFIKTDSKTAVFLPLKGSNKVGDNNFITFTTSNPDFIFIDDNLSLDPLAQKKKTEFNLNMEIQVTPETEAQIIIDKKMGDIIKANGSGNLKIEINPSKDIFKMLGSYEIEKGDYLFTLKSLLNKKLLIESGSSITWNGDPLDANTNITATYRVKTSLKPILGDEYTARIPVDCQILLTQKLTSPNIEFNITLPNGSSEEKTKLATALNTQEKINTQFLGLLGINSFISDASVSASSSDNANLGTMGLYNTVSELLSNQLSNLLSSDKLDFGINYRPGIEEELTSDQVELALSTQIFDDRLTLNGSAFNNKRNSASAPIAGNFNAELKLNKTGKLRAKAFARYNDDFLNTMTVTENEYTTGLGMMYREEFNNFKDLLFRTRHLFSTEPPSSYNLGKEVSESDSTSAPKK